MMEFTIKIRIDTQDERIAYNELRQSLNFCGLDVEIQDTWLKNNRPMPEYMAERTAALWLATHDPLSIDHRIKHTGKWQDKYREFVELTKSMSFRATPDLDSWIDWAETRGNVRWRKIAFAKHRPEDEGEGT